MGSKSRTEAFFYFCFSGISLIIISVDKSTREIQLFIMGITLIFTCLVVSFLLVLLFTDIIIMNTGTRHQSRWVAIGIMMIPLGSTYANSALGVSSTLIGLIISLYAIYYRERKSHDGNESGVETREISGAEGEI